MLKRTCLLICLVVLLLGSRGQAQTVPTYNAWEIMAALPTIKELPGWHNALYGLMPIDDKTNPLMGLASFFAFRASDNMSITVNVGVCSTVDSAKKWMFFVHDSGSPIPRPEDADYREVKIAETLRVDKDYRMIRMQEGHAFIVIGLWPPPQVTKTATGKTIATYDDPTRDEVELALSLARMVMDRLTAMGVTRKDRESAPKWAKDELPARLELGRKKYAEWQAKQPKTKAP